MLSLSPEKKALMTDRLNLAKAGACLIAADLDLGPCLEQATAAPNSQRWSFAYGSVIVVIDKSSTHPILGPLVNDPTQRTTFASSPRTTRVGGVA